MKKSILSFLAFSLISLNANTINSQLLKPNSSIHDFTFNSNSSNTANTKKNILDKITYELNKKLTIVPRLFKIENCLKGESSSEYRYCPESLSRAAEFWSYDSSVVIEHKNYVEDLEQGKNKEYSSKVRDFMDGYSGVSENTIVDYDNGSMIKHTGLVKDYSEGGGVGDGAGGDCVVKQRGFFFSAKKLDNLELYYREESGHKYYAYYNKKDYIINIKRGGPFDWRGYGKCLSDGRLLTLSNNVTEVELAYGKIVDISWHAYLFYFTLENITKKGGCKKGYKKENNKCVKLVKYNFYSYGCDSGYTPINKGFTSFIKTDPNKSKENWNTLDDAVNSPTPPPSNCKKTVRYKYYDYKCSRGYTAINKGLTSPCNKIDTNKNGDSSVDLGKACNNSTPPPSNCYKDINYKYYSYSCNLGYSTKNHGLKTCPKTDPDKSKNNSSLLDDNCNSEKPPVGNCKKSVSYLAYEYKCNNKNKFDNKFVPINSGLKNCTKKDNDKVSVNKTTLDNNCNSPTPPSSNCRAKEYTCNQNESQPAKVNGIWQCSPFPCSSNNKCGVGLCQDTVPSNEYFMPKTMNPIKNPENGVCDAVICDAVLNETISYCATEGCPMTAGVYEKNGRCYIDECPLDTVINAYGDCVEK